MKRLPMLFKTRSAQRDQGADANRLASIEQSIRKAIADAEAEKKGLSHRLEKSRSQAAVMMGNEIYGDSERDPEAEKLLTDAESEMSRALKRTRELDAHLQHLCEVLAAVQKQRDSVVPTVVPDTP